MQSFVEHFTMIIHLYPVASTCASICFTKCHTWLLVSSTLCITLSMNYQFISILVSIIFLKNSEK